jgi:agarase
MQHAMICAMMALSMSPGQESPVYDRYGGWKPLKGRATGFFHVETLGGRRWIVTPEGHAFISKGVCHVSYAADHAPSLGYSPYGRVTEAKYGSAQAWAKVAAERMKAWGLNSVGAWSSAEMHEQGLAYAPILNIAANVGKDLWLTGGVVDVFAPEFTDGARKLANQRCKPLRDDPWLLGYFTDNELRWGPDWRSKESLLESFLKMPAGSPGRARAEGALKEHGGEIGEPAKAAFQRLVAEQYFRVCMEAIRSADPNHMVIGCRFAGYAPEPVLQGLRDHVDIVSYNDYGFEPPVWNLQRIVEITGKPFMITEFSFKARDSGLPNTKGAGMPVDTQNDRAGKFEGYVTRLAAIPEWVGYHWFEWCDEPKEGRFDGENSNYGLVRIDDTPWEVLTERFTRLNAGLEALKLKAQPR